MSLSLKEKLTPIVMDRSSGSLHLLQSLLNIIISHASEERQVSKTDLMEAADICLIHLGHFAVIYHYFNQLKQFSDDLSEEQIKGRDLIHFIRDYMHQWDEKLKTATGRCVKTLSPFNPTLLLHSNSGTIHRLIDSLTRKGRFPSIVQTLSGPGGEGIQQAEILASMGCPVKLIHESSASIFMNEIDAILLGADIMTGDFFMNKSGSMQLALLAKHYEKPVFVLADQRKMLGTDDLPDWLKNKIEKPQPMPPDEILPHPAAGIEPLNYYFEWIPNGMVREFFT